MAMFYRKNLPVWERALRVLTGVAMIACGLIGLPATMIGYVLAGLGVATLLTGFVGFCPMCAMVGRRDLTPK